jgi:hypothetical protein
MLLVLLWVLLRVLAVWRGCSLRGHGRVLLLWTRVVHLCVLLQLGGWRSVHAVLLMSRGGCNGCGRVRLWGVVGYGGVWARHLSGSHDVWSLCVIISSSPGVLGERCNCALATYLQRNMHQTRSVYYKGSDAPSNTEFPEDVDQRAQGHSEDTAAGRAATERTRLNAGEVGVGLVVGDAGELCLRVEAAEGDVEEGPAARGGGDAARADVSIDLSPDSKRDGKLKQPLGKVSRVAIFLFWILQRKKNMWVDP